MKKNVMKIAVASTVLLTMGGMSADASTLKPSTLKKEVKSYTAEILKDVKVYKPAYGEYLFKKGKKVVVVKRVDKQGYSYLVLKGNYHVPVNDSTVKIIKAVNGKKDYDLYHASEGKKFAVAYAKREGAKTTSKDYDQYIKYLMDYDKERYNFSQAFLPGNMNEALHKTVPSYTLVSTGEPYYYSAWVKYGRPSWNINNYLTCNPKVNALDITSQSFINSYFKTNNKTVLGLKPGMNMKYIKTEPCQFLGTNAGYVWRVGDVGYVPKYPKRGMKSGTVKEIVVTPSQKVTYKQALSLYGKPTSVKSLTKNRVEYVMTYNKNTKDGYKVEVALDGKYGNVKYLRKLND